MCPILNTFGAVCAKTLIGRTSDCAVAPPSSVMNSRRLTSSIGLPPPGAAASVYRTLNLAQRGRQVLGPDLNRSESRRGAAGPSVSAHDAAGGRRTAELQCRRCPLLVISGRSDTKGPCPLYPRADNTQT